MWNWLDIAGISCIYVTVGAMHYGDDVVTRQFGSAGIMCNILSILERLKPVTVEVGNLIMAFEKILVDIRAFACVSCVLLVGFTLSFTVSMEDDATFDDGGSGGLSSATMSGERLLRGLMTLFQAELGDFDMSQYTNTESQLFFVVFLVLMPVIMLNL
jgi:hypothetical protein